MAAAAKPTVDPRWAQTLAGVDAAANIVQPVAGFLDTGWLPAAKPPAQYFNWWKNVVMKWCAYLRDYELQSHNWATGSDLVGSRVFAAGTTRQLIDTFTGGANGTVRIYALATGGMEVTVNALWGGATWSADQAGATSTKYLFGLPPGDLNFKYQVAGAAAWADTAWATNPIVGGVLNNVAFATSVAAGPAPGLQMLALANGQIQIDGTLSWTSGTPAALGTALIQIVPQAFRPGSRSIYVHLMPGSSTVLPSVMQIVATGQGTLVSGPTLVNSLNYYIPPTVFSSQV